MWIYLNHVIVLDPQISLIIKRTGKHQVNEYDMACHGLALSGHTTVEISIIDSYGYRKLSTNETYTTQQDGFYYNAAQHVAGNISGDARINCKIVDAIGTYVKTEYIKSEGELYRTFCSDYIDNYIHVYCLSQVRNQTNSGVKWTECPLIIGTGCRVQVFSLILDSSTVWQQKFSLLKIGFQRPSGFESCTARVITK